MSSNLIQVKCPRCGHVWYVDVKDLEKQQQSMFRHLTLESALQPRVTSYRVRCPQDGTYVVVDVKEIDDG